MTNLSTNDVIQTIRRFFLWWWAELIGCIPATWRLDVLTDTIEIRLLDEQAVFTWPGGETITVATDEPSALTSRRSRSWKQRKIRLIIPAEETLTQTLTLPIAVEPALSSVLELDIDRLSPFAPEDACFAWRVVSRDRQAETLNVAVHIISQQELADLRRRIEDWGLEADKSVIQVENWPVDCGIPLAAEAQKREESPGLKRLNAGLATAIALALLWLPYEHWRDVRDQSINLTHALAVAKADADRVLKLKQDIKTLIAEQNGLRRQRLDRPTVTELLDRLATTADDQTWLDQLWLEGDVLRIQGRSASATDVVSKLGKLEFLHQVGFEAPVVTDARTQADRFQITATIGKASEASP